MDTGLKDGENAENQVIPPVEETTINDAAVDAESAAVEEETKPEEKQTESMESAPNGTCEEGMANEMEASTDINVSKTDINVDYEGSSADEEQPAIMEVVGEEGVTKELPAELPAENNEMTSAPPQSSTSYGSSNDNGRDARSRSRDRREDNANHQSYGDQTEQPQRSIVHALPPSRLHYPGVPEQNSESYKLACCVVRNLHELDRVCAKYSALLPDEAIDLV